MYDGKRDDGECDAVDCYVQCRCDDGSAGVFVDAQERGVGERGDDDLYDGADDDGVDGRGGRDGAGGVDDV